MSIAIESDPEWQKLQKPLNDFKDAVNGCKKLTVHEQTSLIVEMYTLSEYVDHIFNEKEEHER